MALHTYYSDRRLLRVSWGKRIDIGAVRMHFQLLKANSSYDRNLRVITSTDVEEIEIPLTRKNMLLIKEWREEALAEYNSIRSAIYNLQPVPSAYLNYFSEFFDCKKSHMRQFSTEGAALAWLTKGEIAI
ncbi:hypothetical protein IEN85_06675 [Pelagicoccus sp. NFK12]|uniref:Uncharacterized protein n=1 Tax=Pelagicoccus enzymogenes TaxID=2773457 RepID=A0A927IEL4_9BACT|nr:hypothetical protein [Pelagicoccus enzymogenes]MBD5779172.1 hypothetical protein [Pelagicoccus enzymogenes]MDQ8198476.1 hypothetical protein [Pelagicoccus enzymogenes]